MSVFIELPSTWLGIQSRERTWYQMPEQGNNDDYQFFLTFVQFQDKIKTMNAALTTRYFAQKRGFYST
jgi:hypothetical protein